MAPQGRQEKRDLRLELADRLIEKIEKGTARWQMPWAAGEFQPPINAVTGKPYRGVNYETLTTFSPDNSDPRWCTYKQAQEAGWQVRKGARGLPIEVWKQYEHKRTPEEIEAIRAARAQSTNPDMQGGDIADKETRWTVRHYTVFHASQIDGIPPLERPSPDRTVEGTPDERLVGLSKAMNIDVVHIGSKAFYRPSEDRVYLPPVEAFETAVGHDTTLLHELSHATGHESRLGRDLTGSFGSKKYALEELRAEMSAAMTAAALGIGFDPAAQSVEAGREEGNTAAYLAGWLKALPGKERRQILMETIKEAQAISDYLLDRTPEIERGAEITVNVADPSPELIQPNPEQQAWEKFRQTRDQLPERIDTLLEQTRAAAEKLDPEDEQGQIKLRKDFQAGIDEAFGIITEGPNRGADKHILALRNAGIHPNSIPESPDVLKYHEEVETQWERVSDFRHNLDAQLKAQLQERGKVILQALDDKVPGAEISKEREAVAVYWKHGIVAINENSPYLKQMLADIEQKNLPRMLGLIGHNSQNPASQEVFERMTGITLGKTQKERVAQLESWAGPEKVAKVQEAKKQLGADIARNRLAAAYKKLDGVRVQIDEPAHGGIVTVSGQDYLHIKVSHGTDHVYAEKQGATVAYRLRNLETNVTNGVNAKEFNEFAKATLAIAPDGDVRKALGHIGIHTPDKALSNFLRERQQVRHGEHPDYHGFGDTVANAEDFERKTVSQDRGQAQAWVREMREHSQIYSAVAGLSPDHIDAMARRMEGILTQEQQVIPEKALKAADAKSPMPDQERLSSILAAAETQTIAIDRPDGTQKTVAIRTYLDEGIKRGLTAIDPKAEPLAWVNPETGKRLLIRDENMAQVLRAAHAVHPDIRRAIQTVQPARLQIPGKAPQSPSLQEIE